MTGVVPEWRKSSYSQPTQSDCVEVARLDNLNTVDPTMRSSYVSPVSGERSGVTSPILT